MATAMLVVVGCWCRWTKEQTKSDQLVVNARRSFSTAVPRYLTPSKVVRYARIYRVSFSLSFSTTLAPILRYMVVDDRYFATIFFLTFSHVSLLKYFVIVYDIIKSSTVFSYAAYR